MPYCPNCGAEVSDVSETCPSCNKSLKNQQIDHLEEPEAGPASVSLGETLGSYFTSPFDRFRDNLAFCRLPAAGAIIILAVTMAAFYLVLQMLLPSNRFGDGFTFTDMLKLGLLLALMVLFIAVLMVIIKAIAQAPVDFSRDLLSASFAVGSIILMYILIMLIGMLAADKTYGFDPLMSFQRSFSRGSAFRVIVTFACVILCLYKALNSIIQGLRNDYVKDATAYYLAPFILITGIYLGGLLGIELIGKE